MKKSKVSTINIVLSILFFMCLVSPYLNHTGHAIRNAWVVFSLWVMSLAFQKKKVLYSFANGLKKRKFEILFFSLWMMVVVLNSVFERGYTSDLHLLLFITMAMILCIGYFYTSQNDGSSERVLLLVILFVVIEVARSLPVLWSNPALARMVMGIHSSPDLIAFAGANSVGQYGYYTGLAIVLPIIVSRAVYQKGFLKVVLFTAVAIVTVAISISTFMGALLLVVLGGVILGFIHLVSNGRKNLAKKLLFFSLVFLFFFTIWTTILRQTEQGEYLTGKFENQMSGVLSKGIQNGDQTHRAELWETSMATIVNFPFLGLGPSTNRENPYLYKYVSGHSSWLDQPAEYGLIGFSTYILFFVLSVNRFWTACRKRNAKFYKENKYCFGALVSCFLFVVCGTYNPVVVVTETMSFFYFMTFCGEI